MTAMPTKLDADDITARARRVGCRVLASSRFDDGSQTWPILELECGDNEHAIRFLNEATEHDAGALDVRELALKLRAVHGGDVPAFLQTVHRFVKASVRFVRESREIFQHTLYTLRHRAGDCDDHARAVAALVLSGGEKARVVGVPNARGQIAHVAPQVFDGQRWYWAETTVDARFGEHPRDAARRLGVLGKRTDIGAWSKGSRGRRLAARQ